jgi:hypothetical protein
MAPFEFPCPAVAGLLLFLSREKVKRQSFTITTFLVLSPLSDRPCRAISFLTFFLDEKSYKKIKDGTNAPLLFPGQRH